jgi:hypothetical protein
LIYILDYDLVNASDRATKLRELKAALRKLQESMEDPLLKPKF